MRYFSVVIKRLPLNQAPVSITSIRTGLEVVRNDTDQDFHLGATV
ncbi:hypothetical protein [Laspinema palackyanum]